MKKIALLFTLLCAGALNGMEQKAVASDFQIYKLLSLATKNDPQFYLPNELVHAIVITACKITIEERDKEIQIIKNQMMEINALYANVATLVDEQSYEPETLVVRIENPLAHIENAPACIQKSSNDQCTIW